MLIAKVLAVFVALNLLIGVVYHNRMYPRTRLGQVSLGGRTFSSLDTVLESINIKQKSIELSYQDKKLAVDTQSLGLKVDKVATIQNVRRELSVLPIFNLLRTHSISPGATLNQAAYEKELPKIQEKFNIPALSASFALNNSQFAETQPKDGVEVNTSQLKSALTNAYASNNSSFEVPIIILKPAEVSKKDLEVAIKNANSRLGLDIRLQYQAKEYKATANDIGSWIVPKGAEFTVSNQTIAAFVDRTAKQFGVQPNNKNQAMAAIANALNKNEKLAFALLRPTTVTYTYCVSLKGVDASFKDELVQKVAAVYADNRGWNLGGKIHFVKADNNCNFTLWLSAADQMSSFGSICDSTYSCEVTPNVVINFDRWRYSTDAWKGGGGSLDDYRSEVINHETGHWLGFYHLHCAGSGQPAPVMQQQSISLEGCKFNPWPTPVEISALEART